MSNFMVSNEQILWFAMSNFYDEQRAIFMVSNYQFLMMSNEQSFKMSIFLC
jgi:hypothetical protein